MNNAARGSGCGRRFYPIRVIPCEKKKIANKALPLRFNFEHQSTLGIKFYFIRQNSFFMNSAWKVFFAFWSSVASLNTQSPPPPPIGLIVSAPSTNGATTSERTFGVDPATLPAPNSNNLNGSPKARYNTFLFTGDGNFKMGEVFTDNTDGIKEMFHYTYPTGSGAEYHPQVEVTLVYDDTKQPPSYARNINAGVEDPVSVPEVGSSIPTERVDLEQKMVRVQSTRKIVSDDPITFIVTIENTIASGCVNMNVLLEFHFDGDVLDYNGLLPNQSPDIAFVSSSSNVIKLQVSNIGQQEQQNVFLGFTTKHFDNKEPELLQVIPWAELKPLIVPEPGCVPNILKGTDSVETLRVLDISHDPNRKTFTPSEIDLNYQGDVTMDVNFQNDGYGPADEITITDPFDLYLWRGNQCSALTGTSVQDKINNLQLQCEPGQIDTVFFSGGKLVVKIKNAHLRGLREAGYGHSFTEEETMGHLRFVIQASDCIRERYRCSAIANRAQIVFEHNPPVFTNTALLKFRCYAGGGAVACNTCAEDPVVTAPTVTEFTGQPVIPSSGVLPLTPVERAKYKFKWYPEDGLSNWQVWNPVLNRSIVENYTLVATKNDPDDCRRIVVKVPVRCPCNLELKVDTFVTSNTLCPSDPFRTFRIEVSAKGANGSALSSSEVANLKWHTGDYNTNHITLTGVQDTAITIGVYNSNTNCFLEQRVRLKPDPIVVDDDPTDCTGIPIVTGATEPYTFSWEWFASGLQTSNAPTLNLNFAGGAQLTVMDANGCKGTLSTFQCN